METHEGKGTGQFLGEWGSLASKKHGATAKQDSKQAPTDVPRRDPCSTGFRISLPRCTFRGPSTTAKYEDQHRVEHRLIVGCNLCDRRVETGQAMEVTSDHLPLLIKSH